MMNVHESSLTTLALNFMSASLPATLRSRLFSGAYSLETSSSNFTSFIVLILQAETGTEC
jgi:hypothetical protein